MDASEEELTESEKKQVAFGGMLMVSKRQMQEQARQDWHDPKMRAIFEDLIKKAMKEAQ